MVRGLGMSLMNEMLRDLDRRGGSHPEGTGQDSHRLRSHGSSHPYLWLSAFLSVLVVASLVVWQVTSPVGSPEAPAVESAERSTALDESDASAGAVSDDEPETESVISEQPEIIAALGASAAPDTDAFPAERANEAASTGDASGPDRHSPESAQGGKIQLLLDKAREARNRDRLTRPAGDNAYEYYQQVLALSPEHPEVLAGLAAIAQRYRELAEAAMDRQALSAAQQFLSRARSVDAQPSGIQSSEARLQALRTQGEATAPDDTAGSVDDTDASALSVRLDPQTEDRRRTQQAQQWWARAQYSRARSFLEQTIAQWPDDADPPVLSTIALTEFYLESGDEVQAEQLLNGAQGVPEDEQARLMAELWSARGDNDRALRVLENAASKAVNNEPFRALWARLNYAEGHHAEAAEHYQQLLNDFGARAAYWLGLGLAEDAREREPQALDAFRRALGSGAYDGSDSIRRYLEGRVNTLARRTQNREP